MNSKRIIKRISAMLVSAVMLTVMIPCVVTAAEVTAKYYDVDSMQMNSVQATVVTSDVTTWTDGWYVVNANTTITSRVEVTGDVKLIVNEDKHLFVPKGIHVPSESSLTVHRAHWSADGYLVTAYASGTVDDNNAAIGGNDGEYNGNITIYGTNMEVYGGVGGAGIGTGANATIGEPHEIVFNTDKDVIASGGNGAAGIGGGLNSDAPDILIKNGKYTISGKGGAAAIGGGSNGSFKTIEISTTLGFSAVSEGGGAAIGNGSGAVRTYSSQQPAIKITKSGSNPYGLDASASNGGKAFICSASEDPASVPSCAVYVIDEVKILKSINSTDNAITNDVEDCFKSERIHMERCSHSNAIYISTPTGHSRSCTDCRYVLAEEPHSGGDGPCPTCGYGYEAILRSATVDFSGKLKLVYSFYVSDQLKNESGAYIKLSMGTSEKKIPVSEGKTVGENTLFYYPVEIVNSTKTVTLTLHHADDSIVYFHTGANPTSSFSYSVETYAKSMAENGTTKAMRDLGMALRDYGICAYSYFSGASYSPNNSDIYYFHLTDSIESQYGVKVIDASKPEGFVKTTYNVNFMEDNTLRVTFVLDGSVPKENYVFKIDGSEVEAKQVGENKYALYVRNIAAPNLDAEHDFSISYGGNTYTVRASVMSYAILVMQNHQDLSSEFSLICLARSIYFYNEAANVYFEGGR